MGQPCEKQGERKLEEEWLSLEVKMGVLFQEFIGGGNVKKEAAERARLRSCRSLWVKKIISIFSKRSNLQT